MARRSALGKGLGAFFGDDVVRAANETATEKKKGHSAKESDQASIEETNQIKKENEISSAHEEKSIKRSEKAEDHTGKGVESAIHLGMAADNRTENAGFHSEQNSIVESSTGGDADVSRETFIKLSKIEPSEEQPRKKFDEESLQELADSIKEYGILQPLLVKKNGDMYRIIAGERRWRAAKIAGLKEIPVIIREYDRQQSVEIALIENVQRADLNPIEEAFAYQQLMQEFGLKQEEIASRVGKNRATITNSIRLLKLAEPVQKLLIDGAISSGHARALLGIDDAKKQDEVAKSIVEKGLSVREVEKLVKMMSKPPKEKKEKEEERDLSFIFRDLEERMKGVMGTKVMIHQKDKNKGRIEIEYYSSSELERIVELIESIG